MPAGGAVRGPGAIAQMPMTQIGWGWFGRLLGKDDRSESGSISKRLQQNISSFSTRTFGAAPKAGIGPLENLEAIRKASIGGEQASGKFSLHLGSIREKLAAVWHMGGLGRAVEGFGALRRNAGGARDKIESVAKLFGVGGILAAATTTGGIAAALTQYGRAGQDIANVAMSAGVSTRALQDWRGAAELEGGTRADADSSLKGVNRILLAANAGQDSRAVQLANMLKLNTKVDPATFLINLSGSKQFQTASAAAQQNVLDTFGITQGLQPLLRKGPAGIRSDIAQTERNQFLPYRSVRQASDLGKSITSATQAVGGFATAIEARLSPALTPMLKNFTDWLDQLKQSPSAMDRVVKGGEVLAAVLGVTAVGAVAKLVAAVTTGSASMLASPLGILLMAGAGAAEMAQAIKEGGVSGFLKSLLLPQWLQPAGTPHPTIDGAVGGLVGSGGPQSQPDRREGHDFGSAAPAKPGGGWLDWLMPGAHAAEEPGGVKAQPPETPFLGKQSNLALPPLAKPFLNSLAAGKSGGDYNVMYGDKPGQGTLGQYKQTDAFGFPNWPGRMVWNKDKGIYEHTSAAGRYEFEHGTWDTEAAKLGLKDFSPASQDAAAWDLAKSDYFKRTHRDLMADYQAHRGSEIATALQPTWTSAGPRLAGMLDAGPGALADNSKPYADADTGYGERGPLGQTTVYGNGNQDFAGGTPGLVPAAPPGNLVPGGGADTNHNVNINLTGAPPGTRMAVNGTGPATVKTTTQFEFELVRIIRCVFIYRIHCRRKPGGSTPASGSAGRRRCFAQASHRWLGRPGCIASRQSAAGTSPSAPCRARRFQPSGRVVAGRMG